MSAITNIEKLSPDNYATWSVQVKSLLITLDLWENVVGEKPDEEVAKALWMKSDQKALATITLCVKPSELIYIKSCVTSKEAWRVLNSIYRTDSAGRKVALFKKLVHFKISMQDKFAARVNEFRSIVDDLKEIGIVVPDDFASILLLCSLPDEMESFIVAIESRDILPKLDALVSKILESQIRQNEKFVASDEKVFLAKSKRYGSKKTIEEKRSKIVCFKCGKKGHIRSQCKVSMSKENNNEKACCLFEERKSDRDTWILDSGASSHMCMEESFFNAIEPRRQEIVLATGKTIYAKGIGTVNIKTDFMNLVLNNVWYVPELTSNFFSIGKAMEYGYSLIFSENGAVMKTKKGESMLKAKLIGGVFVAKMTIRKTVERVNALMENKMLEKWHKRFGHVNINDLRILSNKNLVRGLNISGIHNYQCVTCAVCKIHSLPYSGYGRVLSKNVLDLIHTDLCGPMRVKSLGGASYFITFIDDFSRYMAVYFLKNKSDAFDAFKDFAVTAETQIGRKIKIVRSDNGKEFANMKFKQYFSERGIVHQTSVSYSPQQNGVAERANRTLVEMARCLLEGSGLPQYLWGEAINTSVYLRNRTITKVLNSLTPYQVWYKKKPSVSHFKIFGCDVVALKKGPYKGSKFDTKGIKLKFVGYAGSAKGYRLYNQKKRSIIIARDCIFFETSFEPFFLQEASSEEVPFYYELNESSQPDDSKCGEIQNESVVEEQIVDNDDDDEGYSLDEENDPVVTRKRGRGRPKLLRAGTVGRPKKRYNEVEVLNYIAECPETVDEALSSPEREHWEKAMQIEFDSLTKNNTWVLVDRPKHKNVVGCKWVFTKKRKPCGRIEKYKARLVAQGCSQRRNIDYTETYAPVVRHSTIRLLLALAAKYKLVVNHVDVVSAYLNGDLNEDIYMVQPLAFESSRYPNKVCKLMKPLYGLKQAGREWNKKVSEILTTMGFKRCQADSCVYFKRENGSICIIGLYVDDMLVACSNAGQTKIILKQLNEFVEAIDKGPASFYLGMEIDRDASTGAISIHQEHYVKQLLKAWGMDSCKPATTPWIDGTVLQKCEKQCSDIDVIQYQSLIGGLMYLAVISRPDISYIVSKLSQFNNHPHEEHFKAAKHVLRYLKQSPAAKITYSSTGEDLVCYTDSDWAGDVTDRKSHSGYVIFMSNGLVSWESKKQSIVALSTMEAEYVALCQGAKDVVFLRALLREMGYDGYVGEPTNMFCDNQSAQFLLKNPMVHKRSKHIDLRFHYVRELFEKGEVEVHFVRSDANAADIMTKFLKKLKHNDGCKLLRLTM